MRKRHRSEPLSQVWSSCFAGRECGADRVSARLLLGEGVAGGNAPADGGSNGRVGRAFRRRTLQVRGKRPLSYRLMSLVLPSLITIVTALTLQERIGSTHATHFRQHRSAVVAFTKDDPCPSRTCSDFCVGYFNLRWLAGSSMNTYWKAGLAAMGECCRLLSWDADTSPAGNRRSLRHHQAKMPLT